MIDKDFSRLGLQLYGQRFAGGLFWGAERYRVDSSDPSSSLDAGDLAFNTSANALKYYDGSAWQIPKAVVSKSAGYPSSPVDGMLHYNESTSALYIYNLATTTWVAV